MLYSKTVRISQTLHTMWFHRGTEEGSQYWLESCLWFGHLKYRHLTPGTDADIQYRTKSSTFWEMQIYKPEQGASSIVLHTVLKYLLGATLLVGSTFTDVVYDVYSKLFFYSRCILLIFLLTPVRRKTTWLSHLTSGRQVGWVWPLTTDVSLSSDLTPGHFFFEKNSIF